MKETTISTTKFILTYGIILGVIWIIYGLFRHITGNRATSNWASTIFELSLHIGIIVYAIYKYKLNNDSFLTLWQALKIGFGIAFISTVMQTIGDIFFVEVISPETIQEIVNSTDQSNEKKPQIQNKIISKENIRLFTISFGIIFNLVLGAIISLLAGAIMQKNRDPF